MGNFLDNYDLPMNELEQINDLEILMEEYKHTQKRMINFEKFMKEKFFLWLISIVMSIVAFVFKEVNETHDAFYFDIAFWAIVSVMIMTSIFLFITHKINEDLKSRKKTLIELIKQQKENR